MRGKNPQEVRSADCWCVAREVGLGWGEKGQGGRKGHRKKGGGGGGWQTIFQCPAEGVEKNIQCKAGAYAVIILERARILASTGEEAATLVWSGLGQGGAKRGGSTVRSHGMVRNPKRKKSLGK